MISKLNYIYICTYESWCRIEECFGTMIRRRTFQFWIFRHQFPACECFFKHSICLQWKTFWNTYVDKLILKLNNENSLTWSTSSRTEISWKATHPSSWYRFRPSSYVTILSYCWSTLLPTNITGTSKGLSFN